MNSPIQAIADGLLGLLSLKNNGQNPQELLNNVQPTLEMLHWYCTSQAEVIQGVTVNANAAQQWFLGLTVPATEFWYVHALAIRANVAAAEDIDLVPGMLWPSGRFQTPFSDCGQNGTALTVPNAQLAWGAQPKILCPPGTVFGFSVRRITTAAAIEVDSDLVITRLRR